MYYQFYLRGQLDPRSAAWFDDLAIEPARGGNTLLHGLVIDQAALYGVIARCRDLGISLIAVTPLLAEGAAPDYYEQMYAGAHHDTTD